MLVHDPYVKNTEELLDVLKSPDIVIIATNHKDFLNHISEIKHSGTKIIYDVWSMFKKEDFEGIKYFKFGKG